MTCNDCGRDINYCDRYGCREINGVAWAKPLLDETRAATSRRAHGTEDAGRPGPSTDSGEVEHG